MSSEYSPTTVYPTAFSFAMNWLVVPSIGMFLKPRCSWPNMTKESKILASTTIIFFIINIIEASLGIKVKSRLVNLVLLPLRYGNKDIIRDNISECHR